MSQLANREIYGNFRNNENNAVTRRISLRYNDLTSSGRSGFFLELEKIKTSKKCVLFRFFLVGNKTGESLVKIFGGIDGK